MKKRSTLFQPPGKSILNSTFDKPRRSIGSHNPRKKLKDQKEEYQYLEMNRIPYIPRDHPTMMLNLTKAITNTYNSIQFPPEEEEIHEFLKDESVKDFITQFSFPLFWYIHFTMHMPKWQEKTQEYKKIIGKEWTTFLFTLYNDTNVKKSIIHGFIECFPYFCTQLLQDMFLMMSEGNPIPARKEFRMKLCEQLVQLFTNIKYIDALTLLKLPKYFKSPPTANIPPEVLNPPKDPNEIPSIMLPQEDLSTLTPPEKGIPQTLVHFHPTALSPLVQVGTRHDIMPYTKKVKIDLFTPTNGQADLDANFPTLLPDPNTEKSLTATVETYQPMNETRSLLHRAQRPHIVEEYYAKKAKFLQNNSERSQKYEHIQDDLTTHLWQIEICEPETLQEFDQNLRKLLDERKFDETPDFNENDKALQLFAKERLTGKYWESNQEANNFMMRRKETAAPNHFDPYHKEKPPIFHNEPVKNVVIREKLPDVFLTGSPKKNIVKIKTSNSKRSKLSQVISKASSADFRISNKKKEERIDLEKMEREQAERSKEIDNYLLHFRIKHADLSLDLGEMVQEGERKLKKIQTKQQDSNDEQNKIPQKQTELEKYLASLNQNYEMFQEVYDDLSSFNDMIKGGKTPPIRPM